MARKLTKTTKDGQLYVRPAVIEAAIDHALSQDRATLEARAAINDRSHQDYLSPEVFVHLIRNARRTDDMSTCRALLRVHLERRGVTLVKKIRPNKIFSADMVREEVISKFAELFAEDGGGDNPDELDFYEVKFNKAFDALCLSAIAAETRRMNPNTSVSDITDGPENEDQKEILEVLRTPADAERTAQLAELCEAIQSLPPDLRNAVVLHCIYGHKEESAADLCGVTGRTIRNRLKRAAALLVKFKETP
jgi:RNA polymerase sigma factor (sigma-70 family)